MEARSNNLWPTVTRIVVVFEGWLDLWVSFLIGYESVSAMGLHASMFPEMRYVISFLQPARYLFFGQSISLNQTPERGAQAFATRRRPCFDKIVEGLRAHRDAGRCQKYDTCLRTPYTKVRILQGTQN